MKLALLDHFGLDGAIVVPFDAASRPPLRTTSWPTCWSGVLGLSGVVAGYDFHFGHDREGAPAFLLEHGRALGLAVEIVERLALQGGPVSSTAVRRALAEGDVEQAARLLGYRWVVRSDGPARRQARPDAGLSDRQSAHDARLRPAPRHLRGADRGGRRRP